MTLAPETAKRLGQLLLVAVNNNQDHESLNALRALRRTLTDENISAHDLVQNLTAPPSYSEEQALEIYQRGGDDREQDLRSRMPALHQGTTGHDSPEALRWRAMAQFCLDRIDYAASRHQEFIRSIHRQTQRPGFIPSENQQPWLLDIYNRLGGP
jgi:hypothetical protein